MTDQSPDYVPGVAVRPASQATTLATRHTHTTVKAQKQIILSVFIVLNQWQKDNGKSMTVFNQITELLGLGFEFKCKAVMSCRF